MLDALTRLCREPGGERLLAILHRPTPARLAQRCGGEQNPGIPHAAESPIRVGSSRELDATRARGNDREGNAGKSGRLRPRGAAARGIPEALAQAGQAIDARTDGNPILMVIVVDYLVEQRTILDAKTIATRRTIVQVSERNLERLTAVSVGVDTGDRQEAKALLDELN